MTTYTLLATKERRLLWLLAFTQFTVIMDFMVMMPLGPQIMHAFRISPAAFATAVSAYSICSGLSGLLAASYIDRFSRRHLFLAVYLLFLISNGLCGLAPNFAALLVSRAFAGFTGGVLSSLVMVIVSDIIPAERRGNATGLVMTSFSLAAIAGVPIGVVLGVHWGWSAPFYLLVVLSFLVLLVSYYEMPALEEHLKHKFPFSETIPHLWRLLTKAEHVRAFVLTFIVMLSSMLVIPFISPVLVANYGIHPKQISWIYMSGGLATFFSSRLIGKLSDIFPRAVVFRGVCAISLLPILLVTHMPPLPFWGILLLFPFFMVMVSGRMIPIQALLSTVPEPRLRGSFMSLNSALQSLGSGCGAWLGGLWLLTNSKGEIEHYGVNGWVASALIIFSLFWVTKVQTKEVRVHQP